MNSNLNSLDLAPSQREAALAEVRRLAYLRWEQAGRPPGDGLAFWLAAEEHWMQHCYVPCRSIERAGAGSELGKRERGSASSQSRGK
jgi:hypothetical protein